MPNATMRTTWVLAGLLVLAGCAEDGSFRLRRVAVDPAGGGDATLSPDGRRFVTTSRRAGHWDLWAFDLESSRWTQLTDHPADDFEARWSPDGERLTFTSTRGGNKDVWVMRLSDGALTRLTTSPHEDEYPAWSPDGETIVYTGGPWGGREFFTVPAEGGPIRSLTPRPGRVGACAFEPGGDTLVCHRYDLGTGDVIRVWLDGEMAPLTIGQPWDYKPTPSGDGAWIAFSRAVDGPAHVAVMPAAGGRVRQLTDSPFDDRWPTWSRDGHTLLFHRLVDQGTGLRLYDRRTGETRELVDPAQAPLQGSLHPDGTRAVFCALDGNRRVLKTVDLHAGAVRILDTGADEACFPRFSPDGDRIAFVARDTDRWEVSVARADGTGRVALTEGAPGLRGLDGPVDWSPDGTQVVFHGDTEPFEADLYTVDVETRELANLTRDEWFDEAPSWSRDGESILFMSTRGGDWTWGLFRMSLADGSVETLAGPDWEEKNFIRPGPAGTAVWSVYDAERREHLAERSADGTVRVLEAAGEGARWPSYSADGRFILYTTVRHSIEFWLAENLFGAGSPLLGQPGGREDAGTALAALDPATAPRPGAGGRSPVDLHRR